ncbi:unnamed protein product, partial [Discosporangium mesarthrocarpum]
MVDGDAPTWMSSEVYSRPIEPFACPDTPPPGYPKEFPLVDLLENWPPDKPGKIPRFHYLGVCRFDYLTELHKAEAYSAEEKPFLMYNIPTLDQAVSEWSDPIMLSDRLGGEEHHMYVSSTSHFLYYNGNRETPAGWEPPTQKKPITFDDWLDRAIEEDSNRGEKYYFRVSHTPKHKNDLVAGSLPFFTPAGRGQRSPKKKEKLRVGAQAGRGMGAYSLPAADTGEG